MDQPERSAVDPTAEQFVTRLSRYASGPVRRQLERYLAAQDDAARRAAAESRGPEHCGTEHCGSEHRKLLGVPIRQVFAVGREFVELPVAELERLLGRAEHEVRAGAVYVMSQQARCGPSGRRRLRYELYLRRLDRIDNWDLVDLGRRT